MYVQVLLIKMHRRGRWGHMTKSALLSQSGINQGAAQSLESRARVKG